MEWPADREGMTSKQRATMAYQTALYHAQDDGQPTDREVIVDLLTDLRHAVAIAGWDWSEIVADVERTYEAER